MDTTKLAFDMYFSALASIQFHPRNPPEDRIPFDVLASHVLEMLRVREEVFKCFLP